MFFVVWVADSFIFGISTLLAGYVPLYIRLPIAGSLLVLGMWLSRVTDRVVFGEVRDPPHVIDNGVFAHVRHPMYLGSLCMDLGLLVITCSIFCLDILAFMFVFYDRIAAFEERDLVERFGDEYVKYAHRVRRWIPHP